MTEPRASLIVSTWNGRHLLETCLPRALRAIEEAGGDHELIVVDDASSDDTVEFVRREFPQVRLIALERNLRFAGANNAAARAARGDVLVFLNNDMLVEPDFLPPLLRHFEEPSVFAATAQILMRPHRVAGGVVRETGLVRARFDGGFFVLSHDRPESEEPVPVVYAGGGSSAVRKGRFLGLGGFDELFRPFYFEDLDVSYRAQKRGWRIMYEPRSRMWHEHRQTNRPENFPGGYVDLMFGRNSLLFTWKVLTDGDLLAQHVHGLWARAMRARAEPQLPRFLWRAAGRLPHLLVSRHRARRAARLTDREVLSRASGPIPIEAEEAGSVAYGSTGEGKRVLVVGFAPLPFEKERRLGALCFRTWHVTRALLEAGHRVTVVGVRMAGAYEREEERPAVLRFRGRNLAYYSAAHSTFEDGRLLELVCERSEPDAIITVHAYPTWVVSKLDTDAPLWADLNGYAMTEAQARAAVVGDESAMAQAWRWERAALARADAISVVSGRQKYAVIGELFAVGRLNAGNYGADRVHAMPNAVEPEPYRHARTVMRGSLVSEDDVVVLWAGGYNTWTDVDTLFEGLTAAMREEPRLRFVSLGGAMPGRDEVTFYRFRRMTEESDFRDRFIFVGWVPNEEVPSYYLESDVGLNIDRYSYEMLIGCRYRILDMLRAGLPVVTTLGTEISEAVREARLGATFAPGDAVGLKDALLSLAHDDAERERAAKRARQYVVKHRLLADVMQPLLSWMENPQRAPDRLQARTEAAEPPAGPAAKDVTRAAASAAAELLAKALVLRRPTRPWGLDPREVPGAALVIRAGAVALARETVARLRGQCPGAQLAVLAPAELAEETRYETNAPVIAAPGVEACGYRVTGALVNALRERRFDTAVVAGEGNRRAEAVALLCGARRRVEIRADGAAHEFGFAWYKPAVALARGAADVLEKAALTALIGLVYAAITAESWVWAVRRTAREDAG